MKLLRTMAGRTAWLRLRGRIAVATAGMWALLATDCAARSVEVGGMPAIQTVFVIVMENHNWSSIKGSPSAPFLNNVMLPMSSYCEEYYNPPGLHPSEPNYLWLEAGANFGIFNNLDPEFNHQNTTNHLVAQLRAADISWKTYQEDISGTYVPLWPTNAYVARHNPFVYFDDVTGTNDPNNAYGIAHIRPFTELAADLMNDTVARYNFITPNLCSDMHDNCPPLYNGIRQGDDWLAALIPKIMMSASYQQGGAIFLLWDEGGGSDGPIPALVLSKLARGGGYFNRIHYTHSSAVRTMQEIFGVGPLLADAANATNMSDLFGQYRLEIFPASAGAARLRVSGVIPGRTNHVQISGDLTGWTTISTNVTTTNHFSVTNMPAGNAGLVFYRAVQID